MYQKLPGLLLNFIKEGREVLQIDRKNRITLTRGDTAVLKMTSLISRPLRPKPAGKW
uniref:Uncharacterized protein n=1 Tax=Caudovirales sp. ctUL28 TaxID=2826778 RepID=A0A8S5MVV6_9CAUD|nr:MAG TPA: hypothetical protein [Caudovirales sp. ctUL28]